MTSFFDANNRIWHRENLVVTIAVLALLITVPLSLLLAATSLTTKKSADLRTSAAEPPLSPPATQTPSGTTVLSNLVYPEFSENMTFEFDIAETDTSRGILSAKVAVGLVDSSTHKEENPIKVPCTEKTVQAQNKPQKEHFTINMRGGSCSIGSGYIIEVSDCKLGYNGPSGCWPNSTKSTRFGPFYNFSFPKNFPTKSKGSVTISDLIAPPFSKNSMKFLLQVTENTAGRELREVGIKIFRFVRRRHDNPNWSRYVDDYACATGQVHPQNPKTAHLAINVNGSCNTNANLLWTVYVKDCEEGQTCDDYYNIGTWWFGPLKGFGVKTQTPTQTPTPTSTSTPTPTPTPAPSCPIDFDGNGYFDLDDLNYIIDQANNNDACQAQ